MRRHQEGQNSRVVSRGGIIETTPMMGQSGSRNCGVGIKLVRSLRLIATIATMAMVTRCLGAFQTNFEAGKHHCRAEQSIPSQSVTNEAKQSKREQTEANRSKWEQKEASGDKKKLTGKKKKQTGTKRSKEKQILGGLTPNAALPLSPLSPLLLL